MYIDGDVLELDMEMDLEEIKALKTFVTQRMAYIEEIVVHEESLPISSALFSLLWCMKREKPSLKIAILQQQPYPLKGYGELYWGCHE